MDLVEFQKLISIDVPLSKFQITPGVIEVKVFAKDKQFLKNTLDELSRRYLKVSLERRQKKLSDGLSFLEKQTPSLEIKTQKNLN